jgi:hypothetical protein
MALNKLKELLINYPDSTEVALENCNLTSLDEVLPDLIKLKQLKVLRLGNNLLTKLPTDMSGLARLEYLDLTNNEFRDLTSIMSGLFSLPSLKHLYINLSEAEEDDIIISLTNLESFNGTPLTDIPDTDYPTLYGSSQRDRSGSSANNVEHYHRTSTTTTTTSSTVPEKVDMTQIRALFTLVGKYTNTKTDTELNKQWNEWSSIARGDGTEYLESQRIVLFKIVSDFLEKLKISHPQLYPIISAAFNQYDSLLLQNHRYTTRLVNEYSTKIRSLQRDLDHSGM